MARFWMILGFLCMVPALFFAVGLMNTTKGGINSTTNVSYYTGLVAMNDFSPLFVVGAILAMVFMVLFLAIFGYVKLPGMRRRY